MKEVKQQSASKSSLQVLLGAFSGKLINLVSLFLVTPILGPEGFGQLLVVGIILGIFTTVIDIGFENYYIVKVHLNGPNKTDADEVRLVEDVVFNLRLYSNLILFVLQIAISYIGKGVWFEAPVDLYLRILAFNYIANIFGRINEVRLKKRMQFKQITKSKIAGDVLGAISKVVLVFSGLGIVGWAIGLVFGTVINTVVLVVNGNYKPSLKRIPAKWRKEVFWFAKHSWLTGLGIFLYNQASNIILKSFFPLYQVGYVQFSNSYTLDIQSGLLSSQYNVLLPYFANNQHDVPRLRNSINQYIEATFFVLGLPAICAIVFAQDIINILFGPKWIEAYPVFMIYASFVLLRTVFSPALSVLTSLGKMKESTMVAYANFFFCTIALVITGFITKSIYWYALVFVLVSLISEGVKSGWGLKFLSIRMADVLNDCRRNIIVLVVTLGAALTLHYFFGTDTMPRLIAAGVLLGLFFLLMQFLLNRKVYFMFQSKLKMFIR